MIQSIQDQVPPYILFLIEKPFHLVGYTLQNLRKDYHFHFMSTSTFIFQTNTNRWYLHIWSCYEEVKYLKKGKSEMNRSSKPHKWSKGNFINFSNVNADEAFTTKILRLRHNLVESHEYNALCKKVTIKTTTRPANKACIHACLSI